MVLALLACVHDRYVVTKKVLSKSRPNTESTKFEYWTGKNEKKSLKIQRLCVFSHCHGFVILPAILSPGNFLPGHFSLHRIMSRRLFSPLPYARLTYDEHAFYSPVVYTRTFTSRQRTKRTIPQNNNIVKKIHTLSTCSTCTVCFTVACDDVNENIFIFISSFTLSTGTLRTNDEGAGGGGDITKTFREVGID